MRRLRILTWPIHGSYFNTLSRLDHDWLLPVKPGSPEGYGGRGKADFSPSIQDIPAATVRDQDIDLVLYQSPCNLHEDSNELLGPDRLHLPRIYLEHNTPFPDPVASRLSLYRSPRLARPCHPLQPIDVEQRPDTHQSHRTQCGDRSGSRLQGHPAGGDHGDEQYAATRSKSRARSLSGSAAAYTDPARRF